MSLLSTVDLDTLQQTQTVKYAYVAGAMVLVFDYFLMLDHEIEYIWKRKWGVGAILFLLVRYPVFLNAITVLYYELVTNPTSKQCSAMYWFSAWSNIFCKFATELTLILRTYALWNCSNKLLAFLLTSVTISFIACCTVLTMYLLPLHFESSSTPVIVGCVLRGASGKVLLANYTIIASFETIIFVLTVYQILKTYRHSYNPLLITAYRDGILYFMFLFFFFTIGNTVVLTALQGALTQLLIFPHLVMYSVLSARTLLHLREVSQAQTYNITLWPFTFRWKRRNPPDFILERVVLPETTQNGRLVLVAVEAFRA